MRNTQIFAHFPYQGKDNLKYFENFLPQVIKDNNITIYTFLTHDQEEPILFKQLKANGIEFINVVDSDKKWNHLDKITYLRYALKTCQTKYVYILDANDVVLLNDIMYKPDTITVNGCSIYEAEAIEPEEFLDLTTDRPFFNAGILCGPTDKVKDLISKLMDKIRFATKIIPSDQYYMRHLWKEDRDLFTIDNKSEHFICCAIEKDFELVFENGELEEIVPR